MEGINPFKELLSMRQHHIRAKALEGDYYNEDNILMCGKCNTPKEFMLDLWKPEITKFGHKNVFIGKEPRYVVRPIPCEHIRKEMEQEEERRKQNSKKRQSDINRARCFDFDGYQHADFKDDDRRDMEVSRICHSFVDNFDKVKEEGQGMIFSGGVGNGKTYMAGMISNELLKNGYRVKFTRLSILHQKMMDNYGRDKGAVMDYLESCDLVVLDDFGAERNTSTANESYFQIVDLLYRNKIPLIVTTNLTGAEMGTDPEYSHKRIYSRVLERCKPVKFKGKDSRTTGGKEWVF